MLDWVWQVFGLKSPEIQILNSTSVNAALLWIATHSHTIDTVETIDTVKTIDTATATMNSALEAFKHSPV